MASRWLPVIIVIVIISDFPLIGSSLPVVAVLVWCGVVLVSCSLPSQIPPPPYLLSL